MNLNTLRWCRGGNLCSLCAKLFMIVYKQGCIDICQMWAHGQSAPADEMFNVNFFNLLNNYLHKVSHTRGHLPRIVKMMMQ